MKTKTVIAYGKGPDGKIYCIGDAVKMALEANMMLNDYKRALVEANQQLEIYFKVEKK